jgi:hypothetical protein
MMRRSRKIRRGRRVLEVGIVVVEAGRGEEAEDGEEDEGGEEVVDFEERFKPMIDTFVKRPGGAISERSVLERKDYSCVHLVKKRHEFSSEVWRWNEKYAKRVLRLRPSEGRLKGEKSD